MKEKALIKRVKYLPKEELVIKGIQTQSPWIGIFTMFIFMILFVIAANIAPWLVFPLFVSGGYLAYFAGRNALNSQHLEFNPKRLYVTDGNDRDGSEGRLSITLKSPLFLDITVKTKKELLYIDFEQYGVRIGSAAIQSEDLTFIIDSLKDFYGLEIYDSRSTEKEEVLLLRPKDLDKDLMLSYIRVTEDGLRLIVNPTSNRQNFIVNYQRRIIKTAKNKIIAIDDINKITFWIKKNVITINLSMIDNSTQLLIDFKTKNYKEIIITNDIESLVKFLKSKSIFQNTVFEISKY